MYFGRMVVTKGVGYVKDSDISLQKYSYSYNNNLLCHDNFRY